jgi:hypothetical protein
VRRKFGSRRKFEENYSLFMFIGNQSLGSFLRQWKKVLLAHAQQVLNSLVLCQAQRNGCQSIGWVKFPEKNYSK